MQLALIKCKVKIVILLVPKLTYMLTSNLLYVGASRAKKYCLGNTVTINRAIKKKGKL